MVRIACRFLAAVAVLFLVLLVAGPVSAQTLYIPAPTAVMYYPAPIVTYYSPPVVAAPAPTVSYYYAPTVSYYTPSVAYYTPSVSYYAAPAAVTTTHYGLFGRPRAVTSYYTPVYVWR
jgi:hypothetical protein